MQAGSESDQIICRQIPLKQNIGSLKHNLRNTLRRSNIGLVYALRNICAGRLQACALWPINLMPKQSSMLMPRQKRQPDSALVLLNRVAISMQVPRSQHSYTYIQVGWAATLFCSRWQCYLCQSCNTCHHMLHRSTSRLNSGSSQERRRGGIGVHDQPFSDTLVFRLPWINDKVAMDSSSRSGRCR